MHLIIFGKSLETFLSQSFCREIKNVILIILQIPQNPSIQQSTQVVDFFHNHKTLILNLSAWKIFLEAKTSAWEAACTR